MKKVSILFVCLGNICRSPMAEAVMRHLVEQEGLSDKIMIDSAGTGDWHIGNRPHMGTLDKLAEHHVSSEGIYARQLQVGDQAAFDYIIAMDESNVRNSLGIFGVEKAENIHLLLDYVPELAGQQVPDPYFDGNFTLTYELVTKGCSALLARIKGEYQLY
jgi:protein-tyrosine phosphatase